MSEPDPDGSIHGTTNDCASNNNSEHPCVGTPMPSVQSILDDIQQTFGHMPPLPPSELAHGWLGDGRIIHGGRSNNRHHPGEIVHNITHDSGKSSDYRQLNGQHMYVSSTSLRTEYHRTGKEKIIARQAGLLSPKGTHISQVGGEPSSESPLSESPSSDSSLKLPPPLNAKQLKSLKKKIKYKLNRKKRNDIHVKIL